MLARGAIASGVHIAGIGVRKKKNKVKLPKGRLAFSWFVCLALLGGLSLLTAGGAMAVLAWYAGDLSRHEEIRGNETIIVTNDVKYTHISNMSFVGPLVMGIGCFIMMTAYVTTFEARDRAALIPPDRGYKRVPKSLYNVLIYKPVEQVKLAERWKIRHSPVSQALLNVPILVGNLKQLSTAVAQTRRRLPRQKSTDSKTASEVHLKIDDGQTGRQQRQILRRMRTEHGSTDSSTHAPHCHDHLPPFCYRAQSFDQTSSRSPSPGVHHLRNYGSSSSWGGSVELGNVVVDVHHSDENPKTSERANASLLFPDRPRTPVPCSERSRTPIPCTIMENEELPLGGAMFEGEQSTDCYLSPPSLQPVVSGSSDVSQGRRKRPPLVRQKPVEIIEPEDEPISANPTAIGDASGSLMPIIHISNDGADDDLLFDFLGNQNNNAALRVPRKSFDACSIGAISIPRRSFDASSIEIKVDGPGSPSEDSSSIRQSASACSLASNSSQCSMTAEPRTERSQTFVEPVRRQDSLTVPGLNVRRSSSKCPRPISSDPTLPHRTLDRLRMTLKKQSLSLPLGDSLVVNDQGLAPQLSPIRKCNVSHRCEYHDIDVNTQPPSPRLVKFAGEPHEEESQFQIPMREMKPRVSFTNIPEEGNERPAMEIVKTPHP